MQENGHDIRTIIPKYGYVSERKYILREVIRLREIPFSFKGNDHITSAKVLLYQRLGFKYISLKMSIGLHLLQILFINQKTEEFLQITQKDMVITQKLY